MHGTNAEHLDRFAARAGRAYRRFDYSGAANPKIRLDAETIATWLEESFAVIRDFSAGPQIPVGSSMGGWLALLSARALGMGAWFSGRSTTESASGPH